MSDCADGPADGVVRLWMELALLATDSVLSRSLLRDVGDSEFMSLFWPGSGDGESMQREQELPEALSLNTRFQRVSTVGP
jgi:hypothetical protein